MPQCEGARAHSLPDAPLGPTVRAWDACLRDCRHEPPHFRKATRACEQRLTMNTRVAQTKKTPKNESSSLSPRNRAFHTMKLTAGSYSMKTAVMPTTRKTAPAPAAMRNDRLSAASANELDSTDIWWDLTFDMSGRLKAAKQAFWAVRSMEGLGHGFTEGSLRRSKCRRLGQVCDARRTAGFAKQASNKYGTVETDSQGIDQHTHTEPILQRSLATREIDQ